MSASFVGTVRISSTGSFARDFTVQAQGITLEHRRRPGRAAIGCRARSRAMPETRAVTPMRAMLLDLPGSRERRRSRASRSAYDPGQCSALMDGTPIPGRQPARRPPARRRGGAACCIGPQLRAARRASSVGDRLAASGPAGRRERRSPASLDGSPRWAAMEMQHVARHDAAHLPRLPATPQLAVEARAADARPGRSRRRSRRSLDARLPRLEMPSAADDKKEVSDQINRTFNMFNAIVDRRDRSSACSA